MRPGREIGAFAGRGSLVFVLMSAMFAVAMLFAAFAGAQETTSAESETESANATSSETSAQEGSGQREPISELRSEDQQYRTSQLEAPGPLAGTETVTLDTDEDGSTDRIIIRRDCIAKQGASVVLQDDDGTQGTFIDDENVQITESNDRLVIESSPPGPIGAFDIRGGDDTLDGGGLTVATSTDITCEDEDGGDGGGDDDGVGDGGDSGDGGDGGGDDNGTPPDDDQLTPEPQDEDKGPLAGGTAIGDDVLVVGDPGCGPTGRNPCIDQITIQTSNCEITGQGDDLTLTLSDGGEPFRLRDGDNVDITLQQDGTIVANGRKTLGDTFPQNMRDNPTRRIWPIPVRGSSPGGSVNDTFPIVSSTGIGGEGCQAVEASNDSVDRTDVVSNNSDNGKDVVKGTVPDKPLPKTGGPAILAPVVALLLASGLLGFAFSRRRL